MRQGVAIDDIVSGMGNRWSLDTNCEYLLEKEATPDAILDKMLTFDEQALDNIEHFNVYLENNIGIDKILQSTKTVSSRFWRNEEIIKTLKNADKRQPVDLSALFSKTTDKVWSAVAALRAGVAVNNLVGKLDRDEIARYNLEFQWQIADALLRAGADKESFI